MQRIFKPGKRLARSVLIGLGAGIYSKFEGDLYAHQKKDVFEKIDRINNKSLQKCEPNLATHLENSIPVIKQSFKDVNFKGPIYVRISTSSELKESSPINASCFRFTNDKGQVSASIDIFSYPTIIKNSEQFYREMYAVGGHEAIHALHNHHLLIPTLMGAYIGLMPFYFGVMTYSFIDQKVKKLCEIDADVSSALKLGTSDDLRRVLTQAENYRSAKKTCPDDTFRTHPLPTTRVGYLGFIKPFNSKFFESERQSPNEIDVINIQSKTISCSN